MTFKDLKKLVELPLYKEQRVPTVKALEVSGVPVVAEKILENHGSISVYQNGYVIYRAHKRVTVFSLRNCVHYKYDALEGAGHHIQYVMECLKSNTTQVRNIKQYLLATLYNAPTTIDSYYAAQVRHDFGWGGRSN